MKSESQRTEHEVSCKNPVSILQTSNNKTNLRPEGGSHLSLLVLDHLVMQAQKYASFHLCELYERFVSFHPKPMGQSANYDSLLSKLHAPKY